jgi:magnesium-protoporphyrin IX monomethyl ester (oxidative) cyclase
MDEAKARGGIVGGLKRLGLMAATAGTFARLHFHPTKTNDLPADMRLAPSW